LKRVGWRAGTCPVLKAERKNLDLFPHSHTLAHLTALPGGKNLPIGQGAHAGGG